MVNPIDSVNWVDHNEMMDELVQIKETLTTYPMDQGFEAEVMKIRSDSDSFVLKVWSKSSKPDVRFQFHLLKTLSERGLSVSKPVGWGINANEDHVLLTTFDGSPVTKVNEKIMTDIAIILSNIHQTKVDGVIADIQLPKYKFIDYFFPRVEEHQDLYQALVPLVSCLAINQDRLIHGDFHLANLVEANERFTVIDWTNGQLGDPRYDFAWALVLMNIYVSDRYAKVFRNAYLLGNDMKQEEFYDFEALACLRWILLNRNGGTPKGPQTIAKVKRIIQDNPSLKTLKLVLS